MKRPWMLVPALAVVSLLAPVRSALAADLTAEQAKTIATEAYIFAYPLVTMDVTRRVMTNVPPGAKAGAGPTGAWQHMRTYPPVEFREVVRPNFDTLYSIGWLDMRKEPMIVTIPESSGRYYVMPFYDMWTDAYAAPGTRTSGTGKQVWAIVPPGWSRPDRLPDLGQLGDHPHADQRRRRLRGGQQVPGRLPDGAALAVRQAGHCAAGVHRRFLGRHEDGAAQPGERHVR